MIKANELRTGNLIIYTGLGGDINQMLEVYALSLGLIAINGKLSFPESKFQPILLTEEWLIKFGFKSRESRVFKEYNIGINPITHDFLFSLTWLKNIIDDSLQDCPFYKNGFHKIKYVHQLQNLYFVLCGEELTLNKA